MRTFRATAVAAEEITEANTYVVMLAEREDDGARLEIQKALVFDDEDRASGEDTYCLCTEDGATHYGGIASWSVSSNSLTLQLEPEAAEELGVDGGFLIEFPPDKSSLVQEALQRAVG
jgi:hypothetical protein